MIRVNQRDKQITNLVVVSLHKILQERQNVTVTKGEKLRRLYLALRSHMLLYVSHESY